MTVALTPFAEFCTTVNSVTVLYSFALVHCATQMLETHRQRREVENASKQSMQLKVLAVVVCLRESFPQRRH